MVVSWAETRHPILGASIIGVCVILAAGRMLQGRTTWLSAAMVLAGLTFIVLTGSRGPLIAITLTLALLLAATHIRLLLVTIAAGLGLPWLIPAGVLRSLWARATERGWSSRLDIWQPRCVRSARRPLFG